MRRNILIRPQQEEGAGSQQCLPGLSYTGQAHEASQGNMKFEHQAVFLPDFWSMSSTQNGSETPHPSQIGLILTAVQPQEVGFEFAYLLLRTEKGFPSSQRIRLALVASIYT